MSMKSSSFWDIAVCSSLKVNLSFGGICRLQLQGRLSVGYMGLNYRRWNHSRNYPPFLNLKMHCPIHKSQSQDPVVNERIEPTFSHTLSLRPILGLSLWWIINQSHLMEKQRFILKCWERYYELNWIKEQRNVAIIRNLHSDKHDILYFT
jgi:hypothetical protein